ncbi:endonuclease domain-containing protein [Gallibacterium anatis]|uniref:endonuclease domain-containing protein n=1 Tax=Gallibacterium anatis TaxID=750 RepID=UPI0030054CD8
MQPYSKNLKELSQKLRSNQTDAERKLWQRINRDQLLGFRFNRQKPLLNYIVDFYCAKAKLIIELDGSHHYEPEYQEKDRQRDDELRSLGFTVMRFSNDEIYYEIEAVVEQIYLFLEQVQISFSGAED